MSPLKHLRKLFDRHFRWIVSFSSKSIDFAFCFQRSHHFYFYFNSIIVFGWFKFSFYFNLESFSSNQFININIKALAGKGGRWWLRDLPLPLKVLSDEFRFMRTINPSDYYYFLFNQFIFVSLKILEYLGQCAVEMEINWNCLQIETIQFRLLSIILAHHFDNNYMHRHKTNRFKFNSQEHFSCRKCFKTVFMMFSFLFIFLLLFFSSLFYFPLV